MFKSNHNYIYAWLLRSFTRAQTNSARACALVGPGVAMPLHSCIWVVCNSYIMGARDVWHLLHSPKLLCCHQTLPHVEFWVCEWDHKRGRLMWWCNSFVLHSQGSCMLPSLWPNIEPGSSTNDDHLSVYRIICTWLLNASFGLRILIIYTMESMISCTGIQLQKITCHYHKLLLSKLCINWQ